MRLTRFLLNLYTRMPVDKCCDPVFYLDKQPPDLDKGTIMLDPHLVSGRMLERYAQLENIQPFYTLNYCAWIQEEFGGRAIYLKYKGPVRKDTLEHDWVYKVVAFQFPTPEELTAYVLASA